MAESAAGSEARLLPLGSIVDAGGERRMMVIARALSLSVDGETGYFDYGGCLYPEGLIGDMVLYFNQEDVNEVVHEGYEDELGRELSDALLYMVRRAGVTKGDTARFRELARRQSERKAASGG